MQSTNTTNGNLSIIPDTHRDMLITQMIARFTKRGKTRSQIWDELYDPDESDTEPVNILCNQLMTVYDQLYPSQVAITNPTIPTIDVEQDMIIPPLRDYQLESVQSAQDELWLHGKDRCYIQLPTGAGKTRVMYKLIEDDYIKLKATTNGITQIPIYIVLAPRICLANQHFNETNLNQSTLKKNSTILVIHSEIGNDIIRTKLAGLDSASQPLIISGTYYSISRIRSIFKTYKLPTPRLVVADEAHLISKWGYATELTKSLDKQWLMNICPIQPTNHKLVFMSATPTVKQTKGNTEYWGKLLNPVTIGWLISRNILCRIETIIPNINPLSESDDGMEPQNLCDILYRTIQATKSQKAVVFCNTQSKCKLLYDIFLVLQDKILGTKIEPFLYIGDPTKKRHNVSDVVASSVSSRSDVSNDSDTASQYSSDEEQVDVSNIIDSTYDSRGEIAKFEKYPGCSVVFVCKKISMGYDYPPIDFIAFADPKCSKSELAQCIGRGLRKSADKSKEKCRVFIPITPTDFNLNTIHKQRHTTVFQYLQYIKDDVEFEYIIDEPELATVSASKKTIKRVSLVDGDKLPNVTFSNLPLPNVSYIDIKKVYVVIQKDKLFSNSPKLDTIIDTSERTVKNGKGCRDISKCFYDGQRIRHVIGKQYEKIGIYSSQENKINTNGIYQSLNKFAQTHCSEILSHRKSFAVNAWYECECEINGKWYSIYNLPAIR